MYYGYPPTNGQGNYTSPYPPYAQKRWRRFAIDQTGKALLIQFLLMQGISMLLLFLLALAAAFSLGMSSPYQIMYAIQMVANSARFLLVAQLIASLVAHTIPFIVSAKKTGVRIRPLFSKGKASPLWIIAMGLTGLAGSQLVAIAVELLAELLRSFGLNPVMPSILSQFPVSDPWAAVLFVFTICVAVPVLEEFAFRGALLQMLRRYGDRFAVIVTSLAFGLLHGNLFQTPSAFVMGLFLSFITLRAGSIRAAIAVHIANNCLSTIIILLTTLYPAREMPLNMALTAAIFTAGLLSLGFLLLSRKRERAQAEKPLQVSAEYQGTGPSLLLSSWSCWVVLAVYLGVSVFTTLL